MMILKSDKSQKIIASTDQENNRLAITGTKDQYVCEICDDNYDCLEKLKRHLKSNKVWNGGQRFRCKRCGKGFHTETALNKHVPTVHPEASLKKIAGVATRTFGLSITGVPQYRQKFFDLWLSISRKFCDCWIVSASFSFTSG
jgi:uncharacterized C2H2 Zn-finger protein